MQTSKSFVLSRDTAEEATPKISNKALTNPTQLPPPLNLMNSPKRRMARFSNPVETPLLLQSSSIRTTTTTTTTPRRKSQHNNRYLLSNPTTLILNESPWATLTSSLVFLCSKPFLYYLFQLFSLQRKLFLQLTTTTTGETTSLWSSSPFVYAAKSLITTATTTTTTKGIADNPNHQQHPSSGSYELKGLRNYGQTCYLNSVLQSLASLEPFLVYMERLVEMNQRRNEFLMMVEDDQPIRKKPSSQSPSLSQLILRVLQYMNGITPTATTTTTTYNNACPDVRHILELVAKQHSQFRAQNGGPIGKHPQDAEELLQTLINIIVQEAQLEFTPAAVASSSSSSPLFPLESSSSSSSTTTTTTSLLQEDVWEDTVISSFHSVSQTALNGQDTEIPPLVVTPTTTCSNKGSCTSTSSQLDDNDHDDDNDNDEVNHNTRQLPSGEEKKQDEFDIFIPRVNSEEEMTRMIPVHRIDAPMTDTETMSEVSCKEVRMSTAMHIMMTTTSSVSPTPMSCWIGSALKCRTCQHCRPIHNTPIHSIPVVPLAISQSLQQQRGSVDKSIHQNHNIPPCHLEDCLAEFAAVEVVQDVECRCCTIQEKKNELVEDLMMFEQAIQSQSSRPQADLQHLQQELDQVVHKLRLIHSIDADDDAPLEDVLGSEEFYLYNDSIPIRRGSAYKRMLLTRLPAVLTIHVQRRYYDPYSNRMCKTSQHVLFPEILDVAPFCAHGGISFAEGILSQDAKKSPHPIWYRLASVIEHQGNAFYGHYVCYRRDPFSGQWYFTSDLTVKKVSWNDVSRCQAYLLFYEAFS